MPDLRLPGLHVPAPVGEGPVRALLCLLHAGGKALTAIRQTVRHWRLHRRSDKTLSDLARMFNPMIRGWIAYYSKFRHSALFPTLKHIDRYLVRCGKYKRFRGHQQRARQWLDCVAKREPALFAQLIRRGAAAG